MKGGWQSTVKNLGGTPTHIVLVRHAQSAYNGQNRIQGHLDSGLTREGKKQAMRLARYLKSHPIQKIYSSDLGRALSTAREVASILKKRVIREKRLREINLGDWEGLTPSQVDESYENGYQKWFHQPSSVTIPNAEPISKFRRRVIKTIEHIAEKNRGKSILIVTHGGVIATLVAHWLKADFDTVLINVRFDNTGVSLVEHRKHKVILHALNKTVHLT